MGLRERKHVAEEGGRGAEDTAVRAEDYAIAGEQAQVGVGVAEEVIRGEAGSCDRHILRIQER